MKIPYDYITSDYDVPAICSSIAASKTVGLDIETTSLEPWDGKIRLMQLNLSGAVIVVDFFKLAETTRINLVAALANTNAINIGHNLKFEQKWLLYHYRAELKRVFDTYKASVLAWNGRMDKHGLYEVLERELFIGDLPKDEQTSNWGADELTEEQLQYASFDVEHLLDLREKLIERLRESNLFEIAKIEFDAILPEAVVELNGFYLNKEKWDALAKEKEAKKKELAEKLWVILPAVVDQKISKPGRGSVSKNQAFLPGMQRWNLDSNEQMLESLLKLGVELDDTNSFNLAVAARESGDINTVIEYRTIAKNCSSFSENYTEHIRPHSGRIHATYRGHLKNGRYSHSKPNLGQVPRDKEYRECFGAQEPGWCLVIADWSNIEMRIIAELTQDTNLMNVFIQDKDAHKTTAALLSGKKYEEITKEEKQQAKPINFGFPYSMGIKKFILYALSSFNVFFTEEQASDFKKKWFNFYSGIGRWHKRVVSNDRRTGISRSIGGRIRYLFGTWDFGEFFNNPVSSTGADILKYALRMVYDASRTTFGVPMRESGVMIVHHVHDEIIIECREEYAEKCKAILNDCMVRAGKRFIKSVPVVVEVGTGPTWAEK